MVVGNGLIAKRFHQYVVNDKFLIFASGVSNSKSTNHTDHDREFNLIKISHSENKDKTFVYFSTCSITDPFEKDTAYIAHKNKIEQYIQGNIKNYIIFRISNLAGKTNNTNTIFNFVAHHIINHQPFELWQHAVRNLIDVDDFYRIADYILQNSLYMNSIVNIANPHSYTMQEIVHTAEEHFHIRANYKPVMKGGGFHIDLQGTIHLFDELGIQFGANYLKNLYSKYY